MAKRFTDTEKWKRPWFRKLSSDYKLLWVYICDDCDIAGYWYPDLELASFFIGYQFSAADVLEVFDKQVTVDEDTGRWFIADFVAFQYGELVPNNNLHRAVLKKLEEGGDLGAAQPQGRGTAGDKDKDISSLSVSVKKEDVLEKPRREADKFNFETLWARYPRREGKKEAIRHFTASVKTVQDWLDIQNALDNYTAQLRKNGTTLEYTKQGSTWFNNWRDYVDYHVVKDTVNRPPAAAQKPRHIEQELSEEDRREGLAAMAKLKETLRKGAKRIPAATEADLALERHRV